MSKNFEEEYRQMIDSELPDLWDRIEAQLPKTTAVMAAPLEEVNIEAKAESKTEAKINGRRKFLHYRWMPAVIAGAAAILCVLAALPVLFHPRFGKSETNNIAAEDAAFSGGMESAADVDFNYGAADECCGAEAEEPMAEPAAPMAELQIQSEASKDMTNEAESSVMEDPALQVADNASEDGIQSAAGAETASEEKPDLYQVEVQILDRMITEEGETFYEAMVLQNGENGYQKGIRMYFRCAREDEVQREGVDASFRRGEKYILSLYGSDETIESYGIEIKDGELYGEEMYIVYETVLK